MSCRVLCFTPWFPDVPGGREGNYIHDSVMALRDQAVKMNVLLARPWKPWKNNAPEFSAFPADLHLQLLRYPGIPRNYFRTVSNQLLAFSLSSRLHRYAKENDVQLIHAHTEALAPIAAAVAKALGIPSVVTIHGINTSKRYIGTAAQREYFRNALNGVDRVILVGEPLRNFFADIAGRDEHFRVVHNGFDLPKIALDRQVFSDRAIRLVSVSNLHEGKGVELTIQALGALKKQGYVDWHYKIVGDGYMRRQLESLVHSLGLEKQVDFVGAVPHAEVGNYLAQADVFVLPSYREAFGVAYLEAMACGLLTIGVQGQGPSAFIRHQQTGLLVAARDSDDLAKCLALVIRQPRQMKAIADQGKAEAVAGFSCRNHARQLLNVYNELLS